MSEQDHDPRSSDDQPAPSDADLVLEPQVDDVPLPGDDRPGPDASAAPEEDEGEGEAAPDDASEDQPLPDAPADGSEGGIPASEAPAIPAPHEDSDADKATLAAMWAAVRDRSASAPAPDEEARPETGTPAAGPASAGPGRPPASGQDVLTGEEVALSAGTADTADIVGTRSVSPVDTSQVEPVGAAPHTGSIPRIPPIPAPAETAPADEPPAPPTPPSSSFPLAPEGDAPQAPEPHDVLSRRAPHAPDDLGPAPASPAGGEARPAPDALPPRAPERPQGPDGDLTQTAVRRRSLVTPAGGGTGEEEPAEAPWRPRPDGPGDGERARPSRTPTSLDDAIFEGATVVPEVPSRTGAHVWSLVLALVLVPLGWYLLADAGARMTLATDSPMTTGTVNIAAVLELAAGLLAILVIALATARSSLGAHVAGALTALAGLPWVVAPGWTADTMLSPLQRLTSWNTVGSNLTHHLQASGYSGRLLVVGVALLLVGALAHRVRRSGRAEEALRAQVERVNPEGAYLTRRERRRAAKAARSQARH
ncbi:MAG: hypothetical protein LKI58_04400 [Actinomyces sp.]|jgi:hypothetical protein|nr:hypothetical protein [Actinomyces sp.]MCI1787294.1 hypothetical protein [Actinomyces sp.]MCI1829688.1 hypothetical protein [Actinomyces sp.]MCI1866386.1 hypothetical protein [Actinomyces sp.]